MTNTPPASVPEDLIWKHLAHMTTTIYGAKRGRRSVRQGHEELDHNPDARLSSAAFKRRRISAVIVSSSGSQNPRATKLQLQAELRALQKEKENGLWLRESSPLTDLDVEEEIVGLRDELRKQQEEIERMKQELLQAKTSNGSRQSIYPFDRPSTPEIHTRPSSPTRPNSSMLTHSQNCVRTQSGSCISLLSRQPTPPCSPGAASDSILDTTATQDDFAQTQMTVGAMTSAMSFSNDLKIRELERDVASRVVTIENLETQLGQVQDKLAAAQRALLERGERLSTLSTSFVNLQNDASEKAFELERQIAELCELESLKAGLESAWSSRLEQELNERNTLIKKISQVREKNTAEVAILRESLTAAERDKGILAIRLAESETRTQKYCFEAVEQRRAADIELQSQRSANRELEGKVEASLTRISALDQEVQALQQSKSAADTLLFEARSQRTLASAELQEAEARNELLTSQLTINMDENSELQAVLNVYKDLVITLYTQFSTTGE
ncbi:hypothetical protein C0989_010149 [Termitomyces sp. Mn162]|nr:hypothetical protein C0989_010149 [Termitomyces sp. Mn162]